MTERQSVDARIWTDQASGRRMIQYPGKAPEPYQTVPMDWAAFDATTDTDIARQIEDDPDVAPHVWAFELRAIIKRSGAKSVRDFAERFHLNRRSVESWLDGRRAPDAAAQTLITLIDRDLETVARLLAQDAA